LHPEEILEPPAKLQSWFEPQLERLKENSARDFGVVRDSFEEHVRRGMHQLMDWPSVDG